MNFNAGHGCRFSGFVEGYFFDIQRAIACNKKCIDNNRWEGCISANSLTDLKTLGTAE
jgi:hypothetical protein